MVQSKSVIKGIKWSAVSQFGRQMFQFFTTIILARLLTPVDIGLAGMALLVIGFLNVFKDFGTSAAIIQKKEVTDRLLSSLFWFNMFLGIVLSSLMFIFAGFLSFIFGDLRLFPLFQVLSLIFVINSFGVVIQALLERRLAFSIIARIEVISTIISSFIGICMAFSGFGVWSLVFQSLAASMVSSSLLLIKGGWKPSLSFAYHDAVSVLNYSSNLTGFNVFNYFVRNADNFLIGKFLGAKELGYYSLAYRIMLYPLQNLTAIIGRVMFPVFSKINEDNEHFKKVYVQMTSFIAICTFPLMMGIGVLSDKLIISFFGVQWADTAKILLFLAPVGLLQSVDATTGIIFQAKGKTNWLFIWGVITGVIFVPAYSVGLKWGVTGVACSYLVAYLLIFYPALHFPFQLIKLKVGTFLKDLSGIFWISLIMMVVLALIRMVFSPFYQTVNLSFLIVLGVLMYSLLIYRYKKEFLLKILYMLINKNPQSKQNK
ncbi:MAG: MOP flippase family protein [archaeon]